MGKNAGFQVLKRSDLAVFEPDAISVHPLIESDKSHALGIPYAQGLLESTWNISENQLGIALDADRRPQITG
jgi:hypothetical protein